MNLCKCLLALMTVLASLYSPTLLALSSDRDQAFTIDADSAEYDDLLGTTTYAGGVVMQQGSMRIEAEEVVIYRNRNRITRIVAIGDPARYQQQPNIDEGEVVAQAKRLEYNISEETLRLAEDALLQQEGTSLSGSRIDYDVKKSLVKAGGDASAAERVHMVIPPRALKQETDEN